jgi:hypothetical protein
MTNKRILKLRQIIRERIPQDIVTLEPIAHKYGNRLDPYRDYRSVTTKLKVIANPIWTEWRVNRIMEFMRDRPHDGSEDYGEYLKRAKEYPEKLFQQAGDRGTKVHHYADLYFKQWISEDSQPANILAYCAGEGDSTVFSALRSLEAWVNSVGYVPLASEFVLWEDYKCKDKKCGHEGRECLNLRGIAGTCDGVGVIGNELVGVDWKTSNNLREDYELQVSQYAYLFHKFTRLRLDKAFVVKLDKADGDIERPDVVTEFGKRQKTFQLASDLYDDMQYLREDRKEIKKARRRKV